MRFHQEDDGDSDEDNQDGVIMVTSAHLAVATKTIHLWKSDPLMHLPLLGTLI